MVKDGLLYRIGHAWPQSAEDLAQALEKEPFEPCGPTEAKKTGWVPPRGDAHGALVEASDGQWVARFAIEVRKVPGDALRKLVEEKCEAIEKQTGRKPGKKEQRDLKDDALLELLPHAFPKRSDHTVWINSRERFMWIDAGSNTKADDVVTSLVRTATGPFKIRMINTEHSPQSVMSNWLGSESPEDVMPAEFACGDDCELKGTGDVPSKIRFSRHALHVEQVRQCIREGKLPTRIGLVYDGRVGFVMTDALAIKKVVFQEPVMESASAPEDGEDRFDADFALTTGELSPLLRDLIAALGGEMIPEDDEEDADAAAEA